MPRADAERLRRQYPVFEYSGFDAAPSAAGLDVRLLEHFERPTALADGDTAADWFRMFGRYLLTATPTERHAELLAALDRRAAPALRTESGAWTADYVRLRWWAVAR